MKKARSRSKRISTSLSQTVTDEIYARCQSIATVAALLESCAEANQGDVMQSKIISHAGYMIREDVRRLEMQIVRLTK